MLNLFMIIRIVGWIIPLLYDRIVIIVVGWLCTMTRSSVAGIWWVIIVPAAIRSRRCRMIVCRIINSVVMRRKVISTRHCDAWIGRPI